MRLLKIVLVLHVIALLVSTSLTVQGQEATPMALNPDTPSYAAPGPYAVGVTAFLLDKGTPDALLLVAWYPALKADDQSATPLTLPDDYKLSDQQRKVLGSNYGDEVATANATPDNSHAPYPMVIYSPGYGGSPQDYLNQEEHLASYGFIVIADALSVDHSVWSHYIARPLVIHREIDFAEHLSNLNGSFKGLIDTQHVGVAGHSSGGYTALAAAGAQLNMAWFETWCNDHPNTPDVAGVCPDLLGNKQNMLALAHLDSMPAGVWPSEGDPRVTAVVTQSGDGYVFGPSGLAPVTVPVLVEVGSKDNVNTPEWSAYLTYDNVSSAQKALVVIDGADHGVFVDRSGRNSDLVNHFTTAFLLDTLKGDPDAHKALLPDAVNISGIEYKTTLK